MTSMRRHSLPVGGLLGLVLATSTAGTQQINNPDPTVEIERIQLRTGEPLRAARERILKSGWKPVRMHRNDNYQYSGAEVHLVAHKFFEVDSCSVDAGANCILYYSKPHRCLRVDTVGEQVNDMTVTRWTNECPPE